ncbi:alpha-glucosidase [Amycolatopsis arida]|uniref:Alpha-glucosidase n=1 Tax=Amycolatopsis arida TaxID=587909 RepID=A0A1I5UR03_9PSEU|nr:alpha-amylase family glycosyl hydrolase [Amycolatopsis arida]TDX90982.1 alpha-glucosidase [Amycolatopsis arida]SFP97126.1 alpha-glucosidase [Amycolatopsis arida]
MRTENTHLTLGRPARPWWQDAVIYQVYPRSFADTDGDGIGDLPGIVERLPHLRSLGVDALWISPFFRSPMVDYGYDISDHTAVDPIFGTDADADVLIAAAHAQDLRVLVDIVLPHTSDQHPWFRAAATSRTAPTRDYYVWRDGPTPGRPDGGPPNNWSAGFPPGSSSWTWHPATAQWYLHSHLPQQPDLDWSNPAVRAAQLDVLRFWLDRGVDGVRLDSINRLGKDPAYRDNVPGQPPRQQNWPTLHDYLRQVRALVDEYPDAVVVGEVWEFDQRRILPYLAPDELHLAHNFVFARLPLDAAEIRRTVEEFLDLAGPSTWPAWFLNNHDEPRVVSRWSAPGDDEKVRHARGRLAAMLLLTLRGTPFLYQGEELGLPDTELPPGVGEDRNGRDPQRTPMPWGPPSTAGPDAGFSTAEPWLPIGATAEQLNVAAELRDASSMLTLYRDLLSLRRTRPSLRAGSQVFLDVPRDLLAYLRTEGGERSLVVLNCAATTCFLDLAAVLGPGWSATPVLLASTSDAAGPALSATAGGSDSTLVLGPFSGVVLDPGPPLEAAV